ncbi:hypothetical protein, partial [uncultured Ruminococcus sp.]|uniref:hypothetical protein n=1 Tax=uncultured Ruminococcus sp. TaxID=165186 RepID=UPI0025DEA1E6
MMLSFPRRRRGKDNRQLYSIPDIKSFILVYQRDNHICQYQQYFSRTGVFGICVLRITAKKAPKSCFGAYSLSQNPISSSDMGLNHAVNSQYLSKTAKKQVN